MDSTNSEYPSWETVETFLRSFASEHNTLEMSDAILVWRKPSGEVGHAYHSSSGLGTITAMLEIAKFVILHDEAHRPRGYS